MLPDGLPTLDDCIAFYRKQPHSARRTWLLERLERLRDYLPTSEEAV